MKRSGLSSRYCPIARSSAILSDGWTFVILRELFVGNRRFGGLQEQTGMSPRSLTTRLTHLVDEGILKKAPDVHAGHFEYRLTRKGAELWPLVMMLKQWGDKWAGPWEDGIAMPVLHDGHDHTLKLGLICEDCGEKVGLESGRVEMSDAMRADRDEMAATFTKGFRKSQRSTSSG